MQSVNADDLHATERLNQAGAMLLALCQSEELDAR
jgi:hypothetical protein